MEEKAATEQIENISNRENVSTTSSDGETACGTMSLQAYLALAVRGNIETWQPFRRTSNHT